MNTLKNLVNSFLSLAGYKGKPFWIHKSPIHGSGVFAARDLKAGEDIGLALRLEEASRENISYSRTFLGMYVNHAKKAGNSTLELKDKDYHFIATENIKYNDEILTNYKDYNQLIEEKSRENNKEIMVI